ncbi:uncharacterized protein [Medicago truncatula]|uniref:uncharacterized protein n=1 Tax=Medicago truncatula TaxID=3880 RepID=UPI000D2F218D|nr:uncharacterized protein LOC112418343 [Medicago truncatula]
MIWNQKHLVAHDICLNVNWFWQKWYAVQDLRNNGRQQADIDFNMRWQIPEYGRLMCNVDASFHRASDKTGIGCCVRNNAGIFVSALTSWTRPELSPHEGETLGLWQAMSWAFSSGFQNVIFETDSKMLVDAVHSDSAGIPKFYVIVSKIRGLLALHYNFEVKFVRRQANMVAHTLAKATISNVNRHVYDYAPLCIQYYLRNDMS